MRKNSGFACFIYFGYDLCCIACSSLLMFYQNVLVYMLLNDISSAAWSELEVKSKGKFTARKPLISSLRRNLQREHLERLIDLTLPGGGSSAASRTISMLASENLKTINKKIESAQATGADRHDQYTAAHLAQARSRIEKALDADYILNPSKGGGSMGGLIFMLGNEPVQPEE